MSESRTRFEPMRSRNDSAKAIASVLGYASRLQKILSELSTGSTGDAPFRSGGTHSPSLEELKKYLDILPISPSGSISASDRAQLDSRGTGLWNACTRLMRRVPHGQKHDGEIEKETGGGNEDEKEYVFLCYVKTFAFMLLDNGSGTRSSDSVVRILKVSLKTARTCLEFKQLDLVLKVLESAATREEYLSKAKNEENKELVCKLSAEYYSLRVALAWRQDRLDLAEHMFSKISSACLKRSPSMAETLADLFYEIGNSMLVRGQQSLATRWLRRSYDALSLHDLEKFSHDASELRLCVLHALARDNLDANGEGTAISSSSFEILQRDYGNKLPVMLLKLESISKQQTPDHREHYNCLCGVMRAAQLTDINYKMIMHHIHQLKAWNISLATEALQYLLIERLSSHNNDDWVERSLVTLIWMMTSSPALVTCLQDLKSTIMRIGDSWRKELSAAATHATLILIWKRVDVAFVSKEFAIAVEWCRIAQCSIFGNAGGTNKAKIQRKLILCGLGSLNTALARSAFNELPEASRSDPLTRFLMYKVALQDRDLDLGKECLEALCQLDTDSTTYILACVVEAQQSKNKHQAAVVLQRLLDKLNYSPAKGIHLPALLRCTARLLILEEDVDHPSTPEVCEQICTLFECAAVQAGRNDSQFKNQPFSTLELEWFSRNSYNLALKSCTTWRHEYILRLLNTCIKLIDLYPTDLRPEALSDLTLRRQLCDFLGAIITIAQARARDDHQLQQERYLDVRIHVQSFRGRLKPQRDLCDRDTNEDLMKKYRVLLSFDFEAAVRLKQWDTLKGIVFESATIADEKLYSVFADIALCSEAPLEEMVVIFKTIIKSICRGGKNENTSKLSRWIRCLFQLALDSNIQVAEDVLDQAYSLARDGQHSSASYPEEELEWLATTAFNQAVDFYLASADAESRHWVQKALDLAGVMHDGRLQQVLRSKAEELQWDND